MRFVLFARSYAVGLLTGAVLASNFLHHQVAIADGELLSRLDALAAYEAEVAANGRRQLEAIAVARHGALITAPSQV
jgi:hypothetical protein